MQTKLRLRGDKKFDEIHQTGRSLADQFLVIRTLPNCRGNTRFGILISKRIGNSVTRNKLRRRLREILRQNKLCVGWDIVLIARKGIEKIDFTECKKSVNNLLQRSDLLSP